MDAAPWPLDLSRFVSTFGYSSTECCFDPPGCTDNALLEGLRQAQQGTATGATLRVYAGWKDRKPWGTGSLRAHLTTLLLRVQFSPLNSRKQNRLPRLKVAAGGVTFLAGFHCLAAGPRFWYE